MVENIVNCRFCRARLKHTLVSLGSSPLANSYLKSLNETEPFYPLEVYVCGECFLAQLPEFESAQKIFGEGNYAYFSSYSDSWLAHAKDYVEKMMTSFPVNENSLIIEVASNDGYLLQYFVEKGIPVLGIEPAENVAEVARSKGIPTEVYFLETDTAKKLVDDGTQADLIVGNNVLAHVPNLNDFVESLKLLLKPDGVITLEFPHLMQLIGQVQFDTIYHEHFSYFSFLTVEKVFSAHGLTLFDVEELPTHGGSLRIYARHKKNTARPITKRADDLRNKEIEAGFSDINFYLLFQEKVKSVKRDVLKFLIGAKESGKTVVGYGAPAKGNTLLNYCGVRTDFLDYTVDKNPHKQNHYLPGSRIPIMAPEKIMETKPDYIFILPWNIRNEIMEQMAAVREWGGKFVVPIPKVEVL